MATYNQYSATPTNLAYLTGDIMPWDDYIILRTDQYTSVAIYGQMSEEYVFEDATVRTVTREDSSYNTYYSTEETGVYAVVNIDEPLYAYGNVIGVSYALPAANNITSMVVAGTVVFCAVIKVFQLFWNIRKGVRS